MRACFGDNYEAWSNDCYDHRDLAIYYPKRFERVKKTG